MVRVKYKIIQFANQHVLNETTQWFQLTTVEFLNCDFQNIDSTGSSFGNCNF